MRAVEDIVTIDTGFERPLFDASHLIIDSGRAAFVDTGVNASVPRLLAALDAQGLAREAVDWVILTHVHLDHAGGAGSLMHQLPNARLAVHPRGARHMIDPTALVAGASAVYGPDVVRQTYGELVPVPSERVLEVRDGAALQLGRRTLRCFDTPGHAKHHICLWDETSRSCFTGDTFGISYRDFDHDDKVFIIASSTPVQFDPDAMRQSIARLLDLEPQAMYLTHYSRVESPALLAQELYAQIDAMCALARAVDGAADRHARLVSGLEALYVARAQTHGVRRSARDIANALSIDIELNAQGLGVWLDAQTKVPSA